MNNKLIQKHDICPRHGTTGISKESIMYKLGDEKIMDYKEIIFVEAPYFAGHLIPRHKSGLDKIVEFKDGNYGRRLSCDTIRDITLYCFRTVP